MSRDWSETYLQAEMWFCGDEACDCTQPVVERIGPNTDMGRPWIRREHVWQGTFHSSADHAEHQAQWAELRQAAARLGADFDDPARHSPSEKPTKIEAGAAPREEKRDE